MKDLLKFLLALFCYAGLAPLLGLWLRSQRSWQRVTFALMIFMTAVRPGNFMLMISSIEKYRGHTKGFEVSFIEVLAIALIVAIGLTPRKGPRQGIPGLGWYLLWGAVGLLSLVGSPEPGYALMAGSRFIKGAFIFAAAAMYLRDEGDLRWALGALAAALVYESLFCLKMRLLDGSWQVLGLFEHQNPLAMWAYMSGLPLLAALLWPPVKGALFRLCLAGYGGAGLCILLSVSRAALAAYVTGSAILLGLAWLRGLNARVTGFTVMAAIAAGFVALFAMDSFTARFKEVAASSEVVEEDLRDILNKQSAAMLQDHPWLGIGWNNFGIVNSRPRGAIYSEILEAWDKERGFTIYDENYYANPLTESLYWLLLAETGWLGFGTFALFALLTLAWALRSAWQDRGSLTGAVAAALLVALAICYLHGSVERILTQTKNLSHWLMLAGLAAGMKRNRRSGTK